MKPTKPGWWWCQMDGQVWMAHVYRANEQHWGALLQQSRVNGGSVSWHVTSETERQPEWLGEIVPPTGQVCPL